MTKKGYHNFVSTAKILNFKQGWMDHDIPRSKWVKSKSIIKLNDPISQRKTQIVHSTYPIAQLWLTTTLGSRARINSWIELELIINSIQFSMNWIVIELKDFELELNWNWKPELIRIDQFNQFIFTRGQFWPSGIVIACVCVCVCINHELVRTITHRPFKLGSPNLDQRCKTPWFGSLLFLGMIDLDLQGQI